jgi:hypothetical protein
MDLHALQVALVKGIYAHSPVADLMHTRWGWPIAESLHFIGLCLLVGCVGTFDLRLLGLGGRHRSPRCTGSFRSAFWDS